MTRRLWWRAAVLLLLVACGAPAPRVSTHALPTITAAPTTTTTTSTTPPSSTTSATRAQLAVPGVPAPETASGPQLKQATGNQTIIVTTDTYGATDATITAYTRTASGGWQVAYGPWPGYVGAKGIAPAGDKREGDGRTPTGTFGFDYMFGVEPDPGVKFTFRRITGTNIVWVEDSTSPYYNEWVDADEHPEVAGNDSMYKPGVYNFGAVINYNTKDRTPGLGSGIFLHVEHNRPTAGCVSLTQDRLVTLLMWLNPSAAPSIVIGVAS